MAEYKDVEQIKKRVREDCGGCWNRNSLSKCPDDCGVIEAIKAIDSVPSVDAVQREIEQANKQAAYVRGYEDGQKDKYGRWGDTIEVVRCHECKRQKVDCPMRYSGIDYPSDNGFCRWGKKKSG